MKPPRAWLVLAPTLVLSAAVTGCTFERGPAHVPTHGASSCVQAVVDHGCAARDPAIPKLAATVAAFDGREGWYAREALADAAATRDALVRRVLDRAVALRACEHDTERLRQGQEIQEQVVAALLSGSHPFEWQRSVRIVDLSHPPHIFPFADRVCDGPGLDGVAKCFVFGPYVALADVATLPLGTWFWAAQDQHTRLDLADVPPSGVVLADVAQRLPGALGVPPERCPEEAHPRSRPLEECAEPTGAGPPQFPSAPH